MYVIRVRNVCEALPRGLEYLIAHGAEETSRAGNVLVAPTPVTTIYERPWERVLTSAVRDANPFFHLAEALWMLAGQRGGLFLDGFISNFSKRFGEPDGTIHDAYGHRWRVALGFDQLDHVVEVLKADPTSRQCVLQMWDATSETVRERDLGEDKGMPGARVITYEDQGQDDLRGNWRGRPCNTHAYLRVRPHYKDLDDATWDSPSGHALDITVCCRSNDIIWGAYGANAVHFSVLHEYLAARVGVRVGTYTQVSHNFHAYLDVLLRMAGGSSMRNLVDRLWSDRYYSGWSGRSLVPLVDHPTTFDHEVKYLLNLYESLGEGPPDSSAHEQVGQLTNRFLAHTAWPALMAHRSYRAGPGMRGREWLARIEAPDWHDACEEWVNRRME